MLSSDEMNTYRQAAIASLPYQAVITTKGVITKEGLGYAQVTTTSATLPCRVLENRHLRSDVDIAGKTQSTGTHVVHLPYGTSLKEGDSLKVTTGGRQRTFLVQRIYESSYATTTSAGCVETR